MSVWRVELIVLSRVAEKIFFWELSYCTVFEISRMKSMFNNEMPSNHFAFLNISCNIFNLTMYKGDKLSEFI